MGAMFSFLKRTWQISQPVEVAKAADALRFGVLGAANVTYV